MLNRLITVNVRFFSHSTRASFGLIRQLFTGSESPPGSTFSQQTVDWQSLQLDGEHSGAFSSLGTRYVDIIYFVLFLFC